MELWLGEDWAWNVCSSRGECGGQIWGRRVHMHTGLFCLVLFLFFGTTREFHTQAFFTKAHWVLFHLWILSGLGQGQPSHSLKFWSLGSSKKSQTHVKSRASGLPHGPSRDWFIIGALGHLSAFLQQWLGHGGEAPETGKWCHVGSHTGRLFLFLTSK